MASCVSAAPARAGRGWDPSETIQTNAGSATCEPSRSGVLFFTGSYKNVTSKTSPRNAFGTILITKMLQARDKLDNQSHHHPDARNHYVFDGPGINTKTRVLKGPGWFTVARALGSGGYEKQQFGLKHMVFQGSTSSPLRKRSGLERPIRAQQRR